MQNQLTPTDAADLTAQQLRDEMNHTAYVVARLLETGSTNEAQERVKAFTILREEIRLREGATP
ncbi:hypothetical protein [Brevibacterium yomogidense]|uniref:hypothetical protein n=1 Tax=Brevibacterium yomogidense TaxID=946573 RepID=UPI0018DF3811|nr:hypothetical protein [Brevibacterium yomogidense]